METLVRLLEWLSFNNEFQDSLNSFKIFVSDRYKTKKIKYLHNYIRYEIANSRTTSSTK